MEGRKGQAGGLILGAAPFFLCLAFAFSSSCTARSATPAASQAGHATLTVGIPRITGQDPQYGIQQAARLISFEGLSFIGRDGRAQPRLAESWSESPDGLVWNIKLRSNAFFHDGSAVHASDTKASLERSLASPERDFSPGLMDIVGIEAPSPHELVLRLRNRSAFLLDDLSVAISKRDAVGAAVGTGPYVTTSVSDNQIVMKAFPQYYRGAPSIDQVICKPFPTIRTAWAAMMRGEIDFLYEVGPEALEFISDEDSVKTFTFLRNYVYGLVFNSQRPYFRDVRVRRALNYAVDRDEIIAQAFKGHGLPAYTPTWPQHWAYDPNVPSYAYDPARAAALLDSANLAASSRFAAPDNSPARLYFTCILPENLALWERMALLVQRNLSEIGVDMKLETLPVDEFNQRIAAGNFDAVLTELIVGNTASRPYFFWYSSSRRNPWGYRNTQVDQALDQLRHAQDDTAFREAFRRVQLEIVDDPPAVFLALGETSRAVSRRYQVVTPPGADIFPTLASWQPAETTTRAAN